MNLARARDDALACRACELWKHATQTVFGEGPARAGVMLIGEQPGNEEDREGRPFVGPAQVAPTGWLSNAVAPSGITSRVPVEPHVRIPPAAWG